MSRIAIDISDASLRSLQLSPEDLAAEIRVAAAVNSDFTRFRICWKILSGQTDDRLGLDMKISLEFSETNYIIHLDQAYLKEALVTTLYHVGKLSEKEACLTLGISRRAFEELLPRFGFSVLADTPETIEVELHAR